MWQIYRYEEEWRLASDMRQEEFLKSFQEALTGKVSDRIIQENINYYRNYINSEIRSGKAEEDVLSMLGDPRLLAKTLEESNKFANGDESYATDNSGWSFQGNKARQHTQEQGNQLKKKTFQIQGWLALLIGIVILILVISFVFSVISFLAPIILVAAVGFLIYRLIAGEGERRH